MKIYIKSNRNQYILDHLVDGNKLWDPLEGEFKTLSEEQLNKLRNPTPVLLEDVKSTEGRYYKNGKLFWRAAAGDSAENTRVYRTAGRYKIYINSFPDAALPYSVLLIADTQTGQVYQREVTQGMGDFKRDLNELVEWLSEGNEI